MESWDESGCFEEAFSEAVLYAQGIVAQGFDGEKDAPVHPRRLSVEGDLSVGLFFVVPVVVFVLTAIPDFMGTVTDVQLFAEGILAPPSG